MMYVRGVEPNYSQSKDKTFRYACTFGGFGSFFHVQPTCMTSLPPAKALLELSQHVARRGTTTCARRFLRKGCAMV